jgi:hypothetical protein
MSFMVWTDASASSIIGGFTIGSEGGKTAFRVGVITGGRFHPLSIAKSVPPGDYPDLAF